MDRQTNEDIRNEHEEIGDPNLSEHREKPSEEPRDDLSAPRTDEEPRGSER